MKKLILAAAAAMTLTGCLEVSLDPTVDASILTETQIVILGTIDGTLTAFNADNFECLYDLLYEQDPITDEVLNPVLGVDTIPATCTSTTTYIYTESSNTTLPLYVTPITP